MAAVAIAVLVVAGCAPQSQSTKDDAVGIPRPVPYGSAEKLPETLAADGTTIVVGDPAAATTVQLYEDPRCPVVEEFEATGAPALHAMTLRREAKTEYTLASFRDDRLLDLADQVHGLRSEAFDSAVETMKCSDFVASSEKRYEAAGADDPRGHGHHRRHPGHG